MGVIIVIGIILFIIWISSDNKTSTTSTRSTHSNTQETERLQRERCQREERLRQQELQKQRDRERQRQEENLRNGPRITPSWVQPQIRPTQGITNYKQNWQAFQAILQRHNITRLYHFTDRANLASIRRHGGLYSWHYCQQNNITIPKPGGSSTSWILDTRKGLQNYVRVSFVRDHPMMFVAQNDGRISNPVILEINPEVIYLTNSRYASQNAAKNGVTADNSLEGLTSIHFPILRRRYFDLSVTEKSYYQAEVLILEKIPIDSILNINTV